MATPPRVGQSSFRGFTLLRMRIGFAGSWLLLPVAASIHHTAARRTMPDPIPAVLMGRLAVDRAVQGRGAGPRLIAHAIERCEGVVEIAGVRVMLVHAKDSAAADFYKRNGFITSLIDPLISMIRIG